jgi:hypothetical protein
MMIFKGIKLGKDELNVWTFILFLFFAILSGVIHYKQMVKIILIEILLPFCFIVELIFPRVLYI